MSSEWGYARWERFIKPSGLQASEVGFAYLTRCYKWNLIARAPGLIGKEAHDAYKSCRVHDVMVPRFKADLAMVSQDPASCLKTPAFYRMILADISKARVLADLGHRPLVLLGKAVTMHYLPFLKSHAQWCGSYFPI